VDLSTGQRHQVLTRVREALRLIGAAGLSTGHRHHLVIGAAGLLAGQLHQVLIRVRGVPQLVEAPGLPTGQHHHPAQAGKQLLGLSGTLYLLTKGQTVFSFQIIVFGHVISLQHFAGVVMIYLDLLNFSFL